MRRVVVTPTFVAGLGVVVAAMLAYPMETVFNYAAPNAAPCTASCGVSTQDGGEPASVPGNKLSTPEPSATHSATTRPGSASQPGRRSGGGGHADGHTQASPPQLSYQTSGRARWGFEGTIVITFRPRSARGSWWLRFGYPSARILKVWGAGRYLRHGTHSALVASWDWPAQSAAGGLLRVSIGVAGQPGPPHRCSFNGRPCQIIEHHGSQSAPGGAVSG
jgi:hypothetical protein